MSCVSGVGVGRILANMETLARRRPRPGRPAQWWTAGSRPGWPGLEVSQGVWRSWALALREEWGPEMAAS